MHPDPDLLRDLVAASPAISVPPGRGRPEAAVRAAEAAVGPLPASYRWWLAEYGEGTVNGGEIATVLPPAHADAPENIANRRTGDRLWFHDEGDDGDTYAFALDRGGRTEAGRRTRARAGTGPRTRAKSRSRAEIWAGTRARAQAVAGNRTAARSA